MVNGTVQLPLVCTAATAARIDDPGVSLRWIMAIPMQPKPTELKPLPPRHLYEINTACVVMQCNPGSVPVSAGRRRGEASAPVTHIFAGMPDENSRDVK